MLVRKFARLSNGAETDLLEVSDEVMGALNFLICVMMRDKENVSGIWDLKEHLLKEYVAPLDTGLSMSRAHYQASIAEDPAKVSSLLRNGLGFQISNSVNELKPIMIVRICKFAFAGN